MHGTSQGEQEGNREKMAKNSVSRSLEVGNGKGGWELASNSVCQEPRGHARWFRLFAEPRGAAALVVHPHSSPPSPAPQAPGLMGDEGGRSRNQI